MLNVTLMGMLALSFAQQGSSSTCPFHAIIDI
jgi:cyclic lactone autoinducer peptide